MCQSGFSNREDISPGNIWQWDKMVRAILLHFQNDTCKCLTSIDVSQQLHLVIFNFSRWSLYTMSLQSSCLLRVSSNVLNLLLLPHRCIYFRMPCTRLFPIVLIFLFYIFCVKNVHLCTINRPISGIPSVVPFTNLTTSTIRDEKKKRNPDNGGETLSCRGAVWSRKRLRAGWGYKID